METHIKAPQKWSVSYDSSVQDLAEDLGHLGFRIFALGVFNSGPYFRMLAQTFRRLRAN